MVKLIAKSAAEGLLPLSGPGVEVSEPAMELLTSLGDLGGLAASLKKTHKLEMPEAGGMTGSAGKRCVWFDLSHVMLIGPEPGALKGAAVTDQTDAWCRVLLKGDRVAEMLAYLTPLDLREASFPVGSAARTQVGHMSSLILRHEGGYELFVFRSMAATLVHELEEAIKSLP